MQKQLIIQPKSRRALFLDRDGVINVNHGYVHQKENFDFIEGIHELILAANKAGLLVVIVTNQAGIGRGYYTEQTFHTLMAWVKIQISDRGGQIDAVYFCPYHPAHGIGKYRIDSECRKPRPGMILDAERDLSIDLSASIIVGDNISDIQAGVNAGVGRLVLFSNTKNDNRAFCVTNLSEIIPLLS